MNPRRSSVFRLLLVLLSIGSIAPAGATGNLADLTVVDRSSGRTLEVYRHEGRLWVAGRPGEEYRLELRNRAGADLLAVVSVDGVNVITGETASPRQAGYVLSPGRSMSVQGWRKSLRETAAFYFASLSDSYAARTGRAENVGVIGVALYRRKAPVEPPRPVPFSRGDERPAAAGSSAGAANEAPAQSADAARKSSDAAPGRSRLAEADSPLGTGHGRRESSFAREVAFERATFDPEETIVLHYDSRANLVARGVISERAPFPSPRPFPGFVPDPLGLGPAAPPAGG